MDIKLDAENCCSCFACVGSCPKSCIKMLPDELGFLRPSIDAKLCVSCGKCVDICKKTKILTECPNQKIYAAKNTNNQIQRNSSSGGVFTALSDEILKKNGVIVGAVYTGEMKVVHTFAYTFEERNKMCGSKYTYSLCDVSVFKKVKILLDEPRYVLFSGTPCQLSALKTYLNKNYENLITVDVLCHGIAAPYLYSSFIDEMKKSGLISNINFREPGNGSWHNPRTKVYYADGKRKAGNLENSYFNLFVNDYCLRESCYKCNFASFNRISDITIGDFWGIEQFHNEFDSKDGISIVLVNTDKGMNIFNSCLEKSILSLLCQKQDCVHKQLNGLNGTVSRNKQFTDDYLKYGYLYVVKKYVTPPLSVRIREKLYRLRIIRMLRNKFAKILNKK